LGLAGASNASNNRSDMGYSPGIIQVKRIARLAG
jgi:hypothetical protein